MVDPVSIPGNDVCCNVYCASTATVVKAGIIYFLSSKQFKKLQLCVKADQDLDEDKKILYFSSCEQDRSRLLKQAIVFCSRVVGSIILCKSFYFDSLPKSYYWIEGLARNARVSTLNMCGDDHNSASVERQSMTKVIKKEQNIEFIVLLLQPYEIVSQIFNY